MTGRSTPRVSTRKQPKQARSTQLVADILVAAARVLAREGARRFTTARIADEVEARARALGEMFCAYLGNLAVRRGNRAKSPKTIC